MLHGHKHPKDGISHFSPALTAGVLSYFAQMVTIPMLHKSNLHERHHLKTNGSLRNLSIQYAKQQAAGDSSLWPYMNLCSRDPRRQDGQPTHILHLPQTVNKYDDCLLLWCVGMMIMTCNERNLTSAPSVLHKTLRGQTVLPTHFVKTKSHFSDQYAKHLQNQRSSTSGVQMFFHLAPHVYHYPLRLISKMSLPHPKIGPAMVLS